MSTARVRSDILLPDDHERRQIFYWLKKVSSYTAWNRILNYYKGWAEVTEASVKEASKRGWLTLYDNEGVAVGGVPTGLGGGNPRFKGSGVPESDYVLILKGLAHCEEGVRRLRSGDKRVFKYDANGKFVMADRMLDHWCTMFHRIEEGENGIEEELTPLWNEFEQTASKLAAAWGECSMVIIEERRLDAAAPNIYGVWFQENLPKMYFPEVLQDVPDPSESTLVVTGKAIPCSGIWEPVDAPKSKTFSLFRDSTPPTGPFPMVGCMNYLHGGSPAPQADMERQNDMLSADVTWRLLWRDDRYEDGTIPDEEAGYRFLQPQTPKPVQIAETPTSPEVVFAETGQPAPRTGRWLVEHDLHASITLQAGTPLPAHNSRSVRWVLAESASP